MQNNKKGLLDEFLFFYRDGKILYGRDDWGHYLLRNDSIFVQYLFLDGGSGFYYRNVIEMTALLRDDSILVYKEKCDWCNKRIGGFPPNGEIIYTPPRVYTFKKTDQKPDSTKSFFYNKKWYTEGLLKRR